MRYHGLILEYNRDKTIEKYSAILSRRVKQDQYAKSDMMLMKMHGFNGTAADYVIAQLEAVDPTNKKMFVRYLVNWYATGSMKYLEDAPKATTAMEMFIKFRNKIKEDLSRISFDKFLDLGDKLSLEKSNSEQSKTEEQEFYDRGAATLYHDDADIKIIIPHTEAASIFFGRGTRWCTAAEKTNYFNQYNEDGHLYIILFKGQAKKWQFHFESGQYMDALDHEILPKEIKNEVVVQEAFDWHPILVKNAEVARIVAHIDAKTQIEMVKKLPASIRYIDDALESVQLLAVDLTAGSAALLIQNLGQAAALAALKKNGSLITRIPIQLTDEMIVTACATNPSAIAVHENSSPDLLWRVLRINPEALRYMRRAAPTEAMKRYCVRRDPWLVAVCLRPSVELQLIAVEKNVKTLGVIPDPSDEVLKLAAQIDDRYTYGFIPDDDDDFD